MPTRKDLGSSPLTRGKRIGGHVSVEHDGLIPAHAGKTASMRMDVSSELAHPRSRGENAGGAGEHLAGPGSSPLTRGKRV